MNLRFALLAILSGAPRTGYDLLQIFDRSVGFVWHAPHTQIYPELRRMEQDGLLIGVEIPRGPKANKREYQITDQGVATLRRLASTPVEPAREKDAARLKAAYLEFAELAGAREQFEMHIAHYERWLQAWEQMAKEIRTGTDPIVAARLQTRPREEHELAVAAKVFAYDGMIARAKLEITWAQQGLELLARLARPPAGSGVSGSEARIDGHRAPGDPGDAGEH